MFYESYHIVLCMRFVSNDTCEVKPLRDIYVSA